MPDGRVKLAPRKVHLPRERISDVRPINDKLNSRSSSGKPIAAIAALLGSLPSQFTTSC